MMILLTGGSGCGKSSFAERLCMERPLPRYYIAAMKPYGEGGREKVERHRKMRAGKGFETFECYTEMEKLTLPARGTTLLECVCNLTANEMFDETGNVCDPYARVLAGVENLRGQSETLIVVTNDVGSDAERYSPETRAYVETLGRINAALADMADTVCELVCGIPIVLKGALPE